MRNDYAELLLTVSQRSLATTAPNAKTRFAKRKTSKSSRASSGLAPGLKSRIMAAGLGSTGMKFQVNLFLFLAGSDIVTGVVFLGSRWSVFTMRAKRTTMISILMKSMATMKCNVASTNGVCQDTNCCAAPMPTCRKRFVVV